jgi:hypothetical protein
VILEGELKAFKCDGEVIEAKSSGITPIINMEKVLSLVR